MIPFILHSSWFNICSIWKNKRRSERTLWFSCNTKLWFKWKRLYAVFFFSVVQVTVTTKRVLVKGTQLQQFQSQTLKINRLVASECSVKTHAIHQCHSSGQIGSIFPAVLLVSQKEKHRNNREAVILLSSGGKVPTWKLWSGEIFWRICCLKQVNNVE